VIGASVCAFMIRFEPNLLEEGLILHVAQRMLDGDRLYRDIASFTGPLPFELLAALFRLFGEEIAVARGAVVALHGLACASLYALAFRSHAGPLAHAAAACAASAPILLFPLLSLYFHTTLAFDLSLIAAYPALRGIRSPGWAVLAGVAVAGAALCKQTVGAALAVGLLAAVLGCGPPGRRFRTSFALVAGGAGVAAVTLAAYGVRGDLRVLVHSLVLLPLSFDATFSSPFINLWPPGEFASDFESNEALYLPSLWTLAAGRPAKITTSLVLATQLLYALPFIALAATGIRRATGAVSAGIWINAAVLGALTTNLFPRSDWGHLVFALPPAVVQLLLLVPVPNRTPRGPGPRFWTAIALVLALAVGSSLAARAIARAAGPPTLGPRVPQRPVTPQFRTIEPSRVIHFLRDNLEPGAPLFVARAEPLIYFATDTRNPTPFSGVIPGIRNEQERAILAALEDVRYVVMSDIDQPLYTTYRDQLPAVQHYLERHFRYRSLGKPSWISLLERGRDRGPTAIDLFDVRDRGRAWIRGRDGAERSAPGPAPNGGTRMNRRPLMLILGPRGGGIDFDIDVPYDAVFQAGVGLRSVGDGKDAYFHAKRSRAVVSIATAGRVEILAEAPVLQGEHDGLSWDPLEADLSAYASERAILRLEVSSDAPIAPGAMGFWGSPRIAAPSETE
jgi:hypothetical protein